MEYAIKEHNGKFYPGVWVTEMRRDSFFGKKKPKRTFFTFTVMGLPYNFYRHDQDLPPPLPPFEDVIEAEEYINRKRVQLRNCNGMQKQ